MNENAERINGWAAMLGIIAAIGAYAINRSTDPRSMVGTKWLSNKLSYFVWILIVFILFDGRRGTDDDDDMDGGMMVPSYQGSQ